MIDWEKLIQPCDPFPFDPLEGEWIDPFGHGLFDVNDNRKDDVMVKKSDAGVTAGHGAGDPDQKEDQAPRDLNDDESGALGEGVYPTKDDEPTPSGPSAEVQALNTLINQFNQILRTLTAKADAKPSAAKAPTGDTTVQVDNSDVVVALGKLHVQNTEIIRMLQVNLALKKADAIYQTDKLASKALKAKALALIDDLD